MAGEQTTSGGYLASIRERYGATAERHGLDGEWLSTSPNLLGYEDAADRAILAAREDDDASSDA